jgi:hypothetical protein
MLALAKKKHGWIRRHDRFALRERYRDGLLQILRSLRPRISILLHHLLDQGGPELALPEHQNKRADAAPDLRLLGYQLRDALLERVGELSHRFDIDQLNKRINARQVCRCGDDRLWR